MELTSAIDVSAEIQGVTAVFSQRLRVARRQPSGKDIATLVSADYSDGEIAIFLRRTCHR